MGENVREMPRVIRLLNPAALDLPELEDLFKRALKESPLLPEYSAEVRAEIEAGISDPRLGLFVGVEDNKLKSLLAAGLPVSNFEMVPQVMLFYVGRADRGGATAPLRKAMIQAAVDFMRNNGYTSYRAVCPHTSPAKIKAWQRLFKRGGEPNDIARLMEFKIG